MSKVEASKLFIVGIDGYSLSPSIKTYVANNSLGGLILFKRNIDNIHSFNDRNEMLFSPIGIPMTDGPFEQNQDATSVVSYCKQQQLNSNLDIL